MAPNASNGNRDKKIIGPWIAAAIMAVIFMGVLGTVAANVVDGWSNLAQYVRILEGYSYYSGFVDEDDFLYV